MPSSSLITNFSVEQIFLGRNRYFTATYTNSTGDSVTLNAGRLMGRVLVGQKVLPLVSTATDGSEMPVGVLAQTYTVANGASQTVFICNYGKINENKVSLDAGDTFASVVRTAATGGGSIRDLIVRNLQIELEPITELSGEDNQ